MPSIVKREELAELRATAKEVEDLREQVDYMERSTVDYHRAILRLSYMAGTSTKVQTKLSRLNNQDANPYNTRAKKVKELRLKYAGEAALGNVIVQNAIDIRAALIMAEGINAVIAPEFAPNTRNADEVGEESIGKEGERTATPNTPPETDEDEEPADEDEAPPVEDVEDEDLLAAIAGAEQFSEELDEIQRFIRYNSLDGRGARDLAALAEMEGDALIRLRPVFDHEGNYLTVAMSTVPWADTGYYREVEYWDVDGLEEIEAGIKEVRYERDLSKEPTYKLKEDAGAPLVRDSHGGGNFVTIVVPGEEAVLIRFRNLPNQKDGSPKLGSVLTNIEAIDEAIQGWRVLNKYHSRPQPTFEFETPAAAKKFNEWLKSEETNWARGQLVSLGGGKYSIVGLEGKGHDSLDMEIEKNVQLVAGAINVPAQFLGFPQFNKNRSTSDNQMEPVALVSALEQSAWEEGLTELFSKVLRMANKWRPFGRRLREDVVKADLRVITQAEMRLIIDLYAKLVEKDKYPELYFFEMLPGQRHSAVETFLQLRKEAKAKRKVRAGQGPAIEDDFGFGGGDIATDVPGGDTDTAKSETRELPEEPAAA